MFEQSLKLACLFSLITILPIGLSGCSGNNRQAVEGTITMDGQPMNSGMIDFKPLDADNASTSGTSTNEQGHFTIPADKGLLPGRYRVNIQLWEETNRTFFDPNQQKPVKITAPVQFKEGNQLEATIVDGDNQLQFELTRTR